MQKQIIHSELAPNPSGTYSQAIKVGQTVYLAGQIALTPTTTELPPTMLEQTHQVFKNLSYVAKSAGGSLNDTVKLHVFLSDMANFSVINELMPEYFSEPYPARTTFAVKDLPKNALVEIDAILVVNK